MPELVEMFDPVSGISAGLLKVGASELTDAWAPEFLAMVEEVPAGLFLTDMGRIILGIASGLIGTIFAGTVPLGKRDKDAILHVAAHWFTHPNAPGLWGITQAAQANMASMASNLQSLKQGIASGNFDLIRASMAFTPADITSYFNSVYGQFQALFAPGGAPSPGQQATTPQEVVRQVASAIGYGEVF